MVFGTYGAIPASDLTRMLVKDVKERGDVIVVNIRHTKTNISRSFTLEDEYASCVRKYRKLRLPQTQHGRFFVNYQKGKCTAQPIGKNKFTGIPKLIAKYLKLEDAVHYTGHSFRRSSTKVLADPKTSLYCSS